MLTVVLDTNVLVSSLPSLWKSSFRDRHERLCGTGNDEVCLQHGALSTAAALHMRKMPSSSKQCGNGFGEPYRKRREVRNNKIDFYVVLRGPNLVIRTLTPTPNGRGHGNWRRSEPDRDTGQYLRCDATGCSMSSPLHHTRLADHQCQVSVTNRSPQLGTA